MLYDGFSYTQAVTFAKFLVQEISFWFYSVCPLHKVIIYMKIDRVNIYIVYGW